MFIIRMFIYLIFQHELQQNLKHHLSSLRPNLRRVRFTFVILLGYHDIYLTDSFTTENPLELITTTTTTTEVQSSTELKYENRRMKGITSSFLSNDF